METFVRGPKEGHEKLKRLIEKLYPGEKIKGINVLDAAAGNGHMTKWLNNRGAFCIPVDYDVTQWRLPNVKCCCVDLNKDLPFTNKCFDLILSIETIEHLENPYKLIREFSRTLKQTGYVIITTPNTHCIRSKFKYIVTGFPVLFEFSEGDLGSDEFHLTPITIGHFIYIFKKNHINLVDIISVRWSHTPLYISVLLKIFSIFLAAIRDVVRYKKSHLPDHYLNVLNKRQLYELDKGEQLIVIGQKDS